MAAATGVVDELVKDYLLFRGFTATLRTLDAEIKNDKEKGFRVDRIIEHLSFYINSYDFANLRDYWTYLNHHLFSRLEQRFTTSVRKLEVSLFRLYLVNASQNNKQDKILEFYEKMAPEIQTQSEFREWFSFPFIKNPEENNCFSTYFSRSWQDTFYLSLHNFLSVILQAMPLPHLLNFEIDYQRMKHLQEENESLKQKLLALSQKKDAELKLRGSSSVARPAINSMDLIYDFSGLTEDIAVQEKQQKSRRFPINFSASPLLGKKSTSTSSNTKNKKVENASVSGSKQEPAFIPDKHHTKYIAKSSVSSSQARTVKLNQPTQDLQSSQAFSQARSIRPNQQTQELQASHTLSLARTVKPNQPTQELPASQTLSQTRTSKSNQQTQELSASQTLTQPGAVASKKIVQKTEYEKQRNELFGTTNPTRPAKEKIPVNLRKSEPPQQIQSTSLSSPTKVNTESEVEASKPGYKLPEPEKQDFKAESSPVQAPPANVSVGKQELPVRDCPFLLLSQEEYAEHHSAISYCRFSNTGNYIASVDIDGVVKVWSWSPQPATAATVMSKSPFLSLEWASKTDRWLLLGNRSGNIRLFDVKEMKSFYEAAGDSSYPRVINLCSSPVSTQFVSATTVNRGRSGSFGGDSGIGIGSKVGKLTLWDLKTMKLEKQLPIDSGPVAITCCAYNHNGQLLLTGAVDGQLRIFDMQQHKCIFMWEAHSGEVLCVQFSSDETSCLSIGTDGKFLQWSIHRTGKILHDLPIHAGASLPFLNSSPLGGKEIPKGKLFAFDCEGQYILTCDRDKSIMYQMNKSDPVMSQMMEIKGHKSPITTVDWSPSLDTRACLTGSMDGKIKISTLLAQ